MSEDRERCERCTRTAVFEVHTLYEDETIIELTCSDHVDDATGHDEGHVVVYSVNETTVPIDRTVDLT